MGLFGTHRVVLSKRVVLGKEIAPGQLRVELKRASWTIGHRFPGESSPGL